MIERVLLTVAEKYMYVCGKLVVQRLLVAVVTKISNLMSLFSNK